MTISTISNVNYSNSPFAQEDCKLQAIKIFGKEVAESLKARDGSWEKVIESWRISSIAWRIIKESQNTLCKLPEQIYCETQANDGLIFRLLKTWNNEKQKYEDKITTGELITPHGYIYLNFDSTESIEQFRTQFKTVFFEKLFSPPVDYPNCHIEYGFTLHANTTVTYKPSYYYDTAGYDLQEEFGENEYSRTEALNVYKILSHEVGITIKGQTISKD